jgi:hypothetical protein
MRRAFTVSRRVVTYRPLVSLLEDRLLPGDTIMGLLVAQQAMFQSILQAEGSDLASTASSWGAVDTSFLTESQPDSVPLRATAVAFAGATDSDATSVPNQLAGQGEPLAASDPLTVFLGPWVSPDNSGDSVASDLGQFLGSVLPSAPALPVSQGGVAMPVTRTSVDGGGGPGEVSGPMALSGLKTIAWPTYQQNPLHTGRTPAHVDPAGLTLAWKAPTGFSVPLIVGQAVISMKNQQGIGNDSTSIRSFQLQTGEVNWDYTDKFVFPSQPTFSNNLVVFAAAASISSPFRLYVLNANDGSLRYTVQLSSSFDSSVMPTVARNRASGELMAFVATGGTLYAVNLEDTSGSVAWKQSGSFGGFSMPTMVGSSVVVARSLLRLRHDNRLDEPIPFRQYLGRWRDDGCLRRSPEPVLRSRGLQRPIEYPDGLRLYRQCEYRADLAENRPRPPLGFIGCHCPGRHALLGGQHDYPSNRPNRREHYSFCRRSEYRQSGHACPRRFGPLGHWTHPNSDL